MLEAAGVSRREPQSDAVHFLNLLTPREWTIARALADGLSYSEIGEALSISVHTVASHVKSVLNKTGLTSSRRVGALIREHDTSRVSNN